MAMEKMVYYFFQIYITLAACGCTDVLKIAYNLSTPNEYIQLRNIPTQH
jgi:hypothetical protein